MRLGASVNPRAWLLTGQEVCFLPGNAGPGQPEACYVPWQPLFQNDGDSILGVLNSAPGLQEKGERGLSLTWK